ncbi:unnamed protein product, partial [Symbiodinium sp. CCMP2592]
GGKKGEPKGKKGQGKGDGKKGKGKSNPNLVCWYCGKTGHPQHLCFQNPNRKQINQVEQSGAVGSGSPAPSTVGPSASQHPQQSVAGSATTVRRVDASEPLIFDFSDVQSPASVDIRAIVAEFEGPEFGSDAENFHFHAPCQFFDMTYSDADADWLVLPGEPSPVEPELLRDGVEPILGDVAASVLETNLREVEVSPAVSVSVRAVNGARPEVDLEVILDSGADLSCLPIALGSTGVRGPRAGRIAVRDAQGGRLPVNTTRDVEFSLKAHDGREVVWKERCIVTSVTQPLLALGKLMRAGWIPSKDDFGMFLQHQESGVMVPIDFRGNSLMVHATLRRVDGEDAESATGEEPDSRDPDARDPDARDPDGRDPDARDPDAREPDAHDQDAEGSLHVRATSARPSNELVDASFGWQTLESTGHFLWRGRTDRYIDPATLVPITWPHRTTLVYAGAGWQMLEWCVEWLELKDPVALLQCGMCDCITVLSMNQEEPGDFGVELDSGLSEHVNDSGLQAELELQDADEQMPEVPGQADPPEHEAVAPVPLPDTVEPGSALHAEQDSVITVNGVGLSMESTLGALRAGCKFLNLSQSGSKQRARSMDADLSGHLRRKRDSSALDDHLIYAVRVSTTTSEKQPWERGDILAPRSAFSSPFPSVGRPQVAVQVLPAPSSSPAGAVTTSVAVKVLGKQPTTKGPSWEEKLTDNRRAAVAKWEALLMAHGEHFDCYRGVSGDASAGRKADLVQTLKDCFAGKASATLHSRVGPMMRYVKFTKSAGLDAFPLTESVLYVFMDQYCRTAAATFGRSFLESLNFAVHVLGLDLHVTISGRIQGVAKTRYLEKRKAVQKPALTALHVRTLEKIVIGGTIEEYSGFDRHCAGFFCYTLYARARFSDAQASANLMLDVTENDDGPYGFLEASVTRSKTSYTLERKTRFLPMVAPINGLLDESWGTAWYKLMKEQAVTLREGYPLLSSPVTGGGFSLLPISAEHAARILRELLRRELGDSADIRKLGTHSLKRDTLSGPLRQLGSVVSAVALDHFRPDSTRSGYFPSRKGREDAGFDPNAPEQEELDSSSSGSEDEEAPDHDEVEKACDALASWEPRPGLRDLIGEGPVFKRKTTRVIHLMASSDEGDRFVCGRKPSTRRALSFTRDRREVRTSGLSAADQTNVLAGLKNLKQLAFVSSFTPGQADEKPLIAALDALVKRDTSADLAAQACFRALFQQAYAIVTTEFRQAIERTEDAPSRSLSAPEREERYTRQVKKLTGINIKGETEPSQALVDLCVNIYESNTLRYVAWEKCTSRLAEVQGDAKKDTRFTLDAQGKTLKLESKAPDDKCHVRPSFKQLLRADQKLFSELQDRCRAGIQATSAGRPLDGLIPLVMDLSDVAVLLQSLPGNASSSSDVPPGPWVSRERPSPYTREGKGRGKAGKGRAKGKGVLPKPLVGCYSSTNAGEPICFDHNINGCSRAVKSGGWECPQLDSLESQSLSSANELDHAMPCPVGPAATLVAACASLNERMHDAGSPVGGEPSVGARDCATADSPKRKANDSDRESPGKAPRLEGPEALASDLHRKHLFDAASVLSLFDLLPKADITRLSQAKGSVFAVGSYSHGPIKGLRHFTRIYPNVCRYLCACVLHVLPTHKFSSLLISDSVESQPHTDPNNGPTLDLLIPLTHFSGGSLRAGDCDLDFSRGAWAFNARDGCHAVAPFQGRRVMLIAFSTKGVCDSDSEVLSQLQSCGFALPRADAVMPASPVGPLPDIRSSVTHEPLKVLKPSRLVVLDLFCGRGVAAQARTTIHLAILAAFVLGKAYAENLAENLRLQLTKMQPIMPEFKYMVSVHVADCSQLRLDDKSTPATATFGVFRTPDEFVAASLRLEHPFDAFAHVPDGLIRNLGRLLIDGPLPVMRRRLDLLTKWSAWADELAEPERALHASLDPRVGAVLSGKKLLLLDRIAKSLAWPDEDLFKDLKEGFGIVGSAPVTGVFAPSFKPSEFTEEELDQRSKFLRPALWAKISSSKPEDSDAELWSQTLAERDQKSWLSGPYSYQELTEILGPHWIPVRRFAIFQRGKLRCIDDLSENSVNSSWEVAEKIDLRAMDELLWITSRLMQSIVDRGFVNLRLSSGEVISGPLHTVWRTRPESARPVLKCVDLKSAYKQYAIRPCDSKRCVVSLRRPSDGTIRKLMRLLGVICSEDKELPFSSVADLLGVRLVVVREVDSLFGRIQYADSQIMGRRGKLAFAVLQMRMDAGEPRRIQVRYFGVTLSDSLVDLWAESGKKHLIGLVELYALVLARFVWGRLLDDRRVLYFIDHVGVLAATINCTSRGLLDLSDVRTCDPGPSCLFCHGRITALVLTWGYGPRFVTVVARQAEGDDAREPRMQFLPEPPSEEARLLHEITHLPYASWCPHCIAMKSVPDQHRAVPEGNAREHPTVSFDLSYTGYDPTGKLESGPDDRGGDRDKLTCLIVHCNHTDAIAAIPLPDKSAASMKHAAVELSLGAIKNRVCSNCKANGLAEKAVDVIRSLANVFLDAARHRYGIMIPVSHPLFAWSFVHAAWTYTRFKVKGGLTSYERITGCSYRGKLVPYAEPIFAYIRTANSPKGNPKWVQAVFLSKSWINDMFIVGTPSGIMLSKSVRRTGQPWSTQKTLAEAIAGAPWNFQLGSLGLKTVPQGRIRAPNPAEQAAVVDGSAPELPLPPEVPLPLPSAPLNAEAGGIGDRAGLLAHGADEEPGPAPVSKRATLLLSRGDRTPATPSAVTPGAMPSSVSVQAQHESPLPRVPDEAMLEVFLPKRSAGTGDGGEESPSKTARLRRVANEHLAVNDEELEVPSEWDDLDFSSKGDAVATSGSLSVGQTANTVEHEWDASPLPPETAQQAGILSDDELKALEAQLWFPEEPTLSPDEQAKVDAIADRFEVQRLIRKRVLKCAGLRGEVSEEGFKRLSTKFVRTWRKKVKGGVEMVLRRSRLCAREYKWLEADRLDIFSPASNTAVSKLLPWLFARMKNEPGASAGDDRPSMLTLDVKDAYLTVPQAFWLKVLAPMRRSHVENF